MVAVITVVISSPIQHQA